MKKRVSWIDWAKGYTILFVVTYHALASYNFLSNSRGLTDFNLLNRYGMFIIGIFIMPVFFALSGIVYSSVQGLKQYSNKMAKRILGLGIPYVVFSVIQITLKQLAPSKDVLIKNGWSSLLTIFIKPVSHLWYIYALVLIYLFVGIMDLLKLNIHTQFILSCIMFGISLFVKLPLCLDYLFKWTFIFEIGRLCKEYDYLYKNKIVITLCVFIAIINCVLLRMYIFNWFLSNQLNYSNFLVKVCSIPIFLNLYSRLHENTFNNYFERYGRKSLIIYLVHMPVISVARVILVRLNFTNYFIFIVLSIFIAWEMSVFVCWLAKKIKLVNFIFYPNNFIKLWNI